MATPSSVDDVLAGVTATAMEILAGVDAAGVLLITAGGRFETHGPTSDLPGKLDALQQEFGEGPCVAAAILASRRGEQLESALTSRDLIGQAKGIIMRRYKVDAVRAFNMLRELSQTSNTKLVDIAQWVVETAVEG